MIHGVYVKNRPTSKWRLTSTTYSPEMAMQDKDTALKKAHKEGFALAEVEIQSFESSMFVPESLVNINKETKIFFN